MSENRISSVDEVLALTRRTVSGPSGLTYQVRAVSLLKIVEVFEGIPSLVRIFSERKVKGAEAIDTETVLKNSGQAETLFAKVIAAGLVAPALSPEFTVDDIPWVDRGPLANAILELSKITKEAADALRPFSAVEDSSDSSTPSGGDTGRDRASS